MSAACPFETAPCGGRIPPMPPRLTTYGVPDDGSEPFFTMFVDFVRRWVRTAKEAPIEDSPRLLRRLLDFRVAMGEEAFAINLLSPTTLPPTVMGIEEFDDLDIVEMRFDNENLIHEVEQELDDLEKEIRGRIFVMNALSEPSNYPDDGRFDESEP